MMKYLLAVALMVAPSVCIAANMDFASLEDSIVRIENYHYTLNTFGLPVKVSSRGTGFVIQENATHYFIMTNGHVVHYNKNIMNFREIKVVHWEKGCKFAEYPSTVSWENYIENTSVDVAIITVAKNLVRQKLVPLKFAGTDFIVKPGHRIYGFGFPGGLCAQYWEGAITRTKSTYFSFSAPPVGGQSGSPVLMDFGNRTYIVGILGWISNTEGRAMNMARLRDIMNRTAGKDDVMEVGIKFASTEVTDSETICERCGKAKKYHLVLQKQDEKKFIKRVDSAWSYVTVSDLNAAMLYCPDGRCPNIPNYQPKPYGFYGPQQPYQPQPQPQPPAPQPQPQPSPIPDWPSINWDIDNLKLQDENQKLQELLQKLQNDFLDMQKKYADKEKEPKAAGSGWIQENVTSSPVGFLTAIGASMGLGGLLWRFGAPIVTGFFARRLKKRVGGLLGGNSGSGSNPPSNSTFLPYQTSPSAPPQKSPEMNLAGPSPIGYNNSVPAPVPPVQQVQPVPPKEDRPFNVSNSVTINGIPLEDGDYTLVPATPESQKKNPTEDSKNPIDFKNNQSSLFDLNQYNDNVAKELFKQTPNDIFRNESASSWVIKYGLYEQAVALLKSGKLYFDEKKKVPLINGPIVADAIEDYVTRNFYNRSLVLDETVVTDYNKALLGVLYYEAVQKLKNGELEAVGAYEAAIVIEKYVMREFRARVSIKKNT